MFSINIFYIKEYHPYFHHIAGHDNIIADTLSRLPFKENEKKIPIKNKCLLNNPPTQELQYPLSYKTIALNIQNSIK
jgi:hypothetical protein